MKVTYARFDNRPARTQYLVDHFGHLIQGKVLDVGCDEAILKDLCPQLDYTGVDMGGKPDIELNLETCQHLPFDDGAFDCVVCCDVLEHLDNLHSMLGELIRVSRGSILLSLPNCWNSARRAVERGRGDIAHYGLPSIKPCDRHKWFFSISEAADFARAQAGMHGIQLKALQATEKKRFPLLCALRKLRWRGNAYLNRYAHTVWIVYAK